MQNGTGVQLDLMRTKAMATMLIRLIPQEKPGVERIEIALSLFNPQVLQAIAQQGLFGEASAAVGD